ncbi:MAG TPA: M20/M25/M40 family metallo-hydrolase [Bryobacteraceae bacterium]|nr:M20/M25/M40 family metallo-hydrolase [Bryobacteraceae bacterium]
MRVVPALLISSALLAYSALAAERYTVDWPRTDSETFEYYTHLLRLDTSNPPGNETQAIDYLKPILEREGIPFQVFALDPNRANLVARLKGNGSKKPIILMGHTDVVGVQRDKWPLDPFAAIRKDGFIWGRGSSDDKPHVVSSLMVMLLLHRLHVPLDRDVIFVAEAGEEGTTGPGIDFLVNQHWNDMAAEFALAEGGETISREGKVRVVEITTTEKAPRTTLLVAHGTAGHGSVPRPDNPVLHLTAAVAKFQTWQPPMRLNDTTRTYFERLATISTPEEAYRYNHVADPDKTEEIQRYFLEHEREKYSILRTSIVPTIVQAGFRSNVIPSEAQATLDIRSLPDEDMSKLYDEIRRVINDPAIEVKSAGRDHRVPSPPSRLDSDMFKALERTQQKMFPGAITVPAMLTGATDMAQLRAKGVQAYGFGPIVDEKEVELHGAHSDQERMLESSIYSMVQFLWYTVLDVAAHNQ